MVQCTTDIMDSISNDETNFNGDGIDRLHKETNQINVSYRMRLDPNSIGLRFAKESNGGVEVTDVLFGTTEF